MRERFPAIDTANAAGRIQEGEGADGKYAFAYTGRDHFYYHVWGFDYLQFDTASDQLLVYTLVQGDESVVVEFTPGGDGTSSPFEPRQLAFDTSGYVQMELQGLDSSSSAEE